MSWVDSRIRSCDRPGCTATYDHVAVVFEDTQRADGWCSHSTYSMHMCGAHSYLWTAESEAANAFHLPSLNRADGTTSCSCGEQITTGMRNLRDSTAAYIAHLAHVLASDGEVATDDSEEDRDDHDEHERCNGIHLDSSCEYVDCDGRSI